MYAEVLIEYPSKKIDKTFTYIIPSNLVNKVKKGMHVSVPFNNKIINGFVVNIKNEHNEDFELKEIANIKNEELVLSDELISVAEFMHNKTLCPLITCFQVMFPSSLKIKDKLHDYNKYDVFLELNTNVLSVLEYIKNFKNRKKQIELLEYLLENKRIDKKLYGSEVVKILLQNGLIKEVYETKYRINEVNDINTVKHKLNQEQENVYNSIELDKNNTYLIEGVTGSGKTEIYLNIINDVIKNNKTAIMLVPEISLTMQIVRRFYSWFGSDVAIFHSALSDGEKYDEYMKIVRGEVSIVVGTRSAIFTPLTNIGAIIIDECHSDTYKQETTPRYNAIDVASKRAIINKCPLILGSATPLLEAKSRAIKGVYKHLKINKRANNSPLPPVHLVNMTEEIKKGNFIFSEELLSAISDRLMRHEQVIILLNRRGFSTTITCSSCGYTYKCPNCDITLTYHKTSNNLRCHYCGYTVHKNDTCPECNEDALSYMGLGTEKAESEINKLFPSSRVVRMDQDSTTKKGDHDRIITKFKNHEYDILLGTQMISKGLDFPLVTLVGVLNADASLNYPDFRSNERTFSLLTQVSGRAGRSNLEGLVILQTYNPENEILNFVKNNDFEGFYDYEMNLRRILKYPPYYFMTSIKIVSTDYEAASREATNVYKYLKSNIDPSSIILGPSTHALFKFNNNYRFVIVIKYRFDELLNNAIKTIDELYLFNKDVFIEVDVDPSHI